ncbi:MAG: endonuclease/exonuclease/phosphatase family protein [Mycolicibacterium sp.]|nr:endonuclease/exonuclease/phosphatase family protein [Mycolicibacterium sp.]
MAALQNIPTGSAERPPTAAKAVICGDWNIAHRSDIHRRRGQRQEGQLPASERQWLTGLIRSGWVDVVLAMLPGRGRPVQPWWSWRATPSDNDAGWRIDFYLATAGAGPAHRVGPGGKPAAYALLQVPMRAGDPSSSAIAVG